MEQKLKDSLMLMKEYCKTFNLKPTADKDLLEVWEREVCGPIVAGAFLEEDMPPIIWCDPKGDIWISQDEDLLTPDEPATAIIESTVIQVSINNKRPIHPILNG